LNVPDDWLESFDAETVRALLIVQDERDEYLAKIQKAKEKERR